MKRLIAIVAVAAMAFAVGAQSLKDGVYYSEQEAFGSTGWKDQVVLEVKGGKVVKATWNGVSKLGGADKKTVAANGGYGMVKASKLKKEWNEQAAVVEAYLVQTQDLNFSKFTTGAGNTDAISGASMTVKEFFALAKKAVAAGPVAKGSYAKDGWFFASAPSFDNTGWKDSAMVTVVNGTIVNVVWNGLSSDAKKKSKLVESEAGRYGMEKAAKQGAWHAQAARVCEAVLKSQDPAKIALRKDGKTDGVAGASLTVSTFTALVSQALNAAR